MRKVTSVLVLVLLWSVSPSQAATIQAFSAAALGSNDFIDWGQVGPEFNSPPSGTVVSTNNGGSATITTPGTFTAFQQGSSVFGNFTNGDNLLYTSGNSFTVSFAAPVSAIGTQFQANAFGDFVASLQVFDAALNPLFLVNGNSSAASDGSAIFLGAVSDAVNIASATFSLVSSVGNTTDFPGFLVNRVLLSDPTSVQPVPEPATLTLLGFGAAAAFVRRRRARASL